MTITGIPLRNLKTPVPTTFARFQSFGDGNEISARFADPDECCRIVCDSFPVFDPSFSRSRKPNCRMARRKLPTRNDERFVFFRQHHFDFDKHSWMQSVVRIFERPLQSDVACHASTIELIAVSLPLNSRPGRHRCERVLPIRREFRKLLLRQREIDIDRIERLSTARPVTCVDHLSNVDLTNAELPVERRMHLFLGDERAHVVHRALFLTECRLSRIQLLL